MTAQPAAGTQPDGPEGNPMGFDVPPHRPCPDQHTPKGPHRGEGASGITRTGAVVDPRLAMYQSQPQPCSFEHLLPHPRTALEPGTKATKACQGPIDMVPDVGSLSLKAAVCTWSARCCCQAAGAAQVMQQHATKPSQRQGRRGALPTHNSAHVM
jgi:hypothetical protein